MKDYILEMKNITKEYPGVKALDNVNLKIERACIHALVGENGAGKSTLMNTPVRFFIIIKSVNFKRYMTVKTLVL